MSGKSRTEQVAAWEARRGAGEGDHGGDREQADRDQAEQRGGDQPACGATCGYDRGDSGVPELIKKLDNGVVIAESPAAGTAMVVFRQLRVFGGGQEVRGEDAGPGRAADGDRGGAG